MVLKENVVATFHNMSVILQLLQYSYPFITWTQSLEHYSRNESHISVKFQHLFTSLNPKA